MNLTKLFKIQKQLDDHIVKDKGLERQDLLDKKILALQVELGELANNWRGFKFWSEDQKARTEEIRYARGSGKTIPPHIIANPLLEEYVDCLHFILSIGNETIKKYGKDLKELVLNDEILIHTNTKKEMDITSQFNILFLNTTSIYISIVDEYYDYEDSIDMFNEFFESFISLGEMLGFTWNEIEQAYMNKNKINYERLESGY